MPVNAADLKTKDLRDLYNMAQSLGEEIKSCDSKLSDLRILLDNQARARNYRGMALTGGDLASKAKTAEGWAQDLDKVLTEIGQRR